MLQGMGLGYNLNGYKPQSRPTLVYFQLDLKSLPFLYRELFLRDTHDSLDELLEQ